MLCTHFFDNVMECDCVFYIGIKGEVTDSGEKHFKYLMIDIYAPSELQSSGQGNHTNFDTPSLIPAKKGSVISL